jgi:hypothetical protein
MEKLYCGNCGYPNSVENKFCNNCGGKLINNDTSNKGIKSKKIEAAKSAQTLDETLTGKYQTLSQKLTLLLETSGYFTMYSNNCYIQFLKYETEKKLYVAIIDIEKFDNTEKNIWFEGVSLKFEQAEENLIRSFDIVSNQKTIDEVITITKKIFEEIYLIDPAEPFFYEVLKEANIENSDTEGKENKMETENNKPESKKTFMYLGLVMLILWGLYSLQLNRNNIHLPDIDLHFYTQSHIKEKAYQEAIKNIKSGLRNPNGATVDPNGPNPIIENGNNSFTFKGFVNGPSDAGIVLQANYKITLKYMKGDIDIDSNWQVSDFDISNGLSKIFNSN